MEIDFFKNPEENRLNRVSDKESQKEEVISKEQNITIQQNIEKDISVSDFTKLESFFISGNRYDPSNLILIRIPSNLELELRKILLGMRCKGQNVNLKTYLENIILCHFIQFKDEIKALEKNILKANDPKDPRNDPKDPR